MPVATRPRRTSRPTALTPAAPDTVALAAAANLALGQRDYAAAAASLGQLVPHQPNDGRTLLNYGASLKELGRFEEAIPVLQHAVTLDPTQYGAWHNLGGVCLELQRYDDAIAAFANAIRLKNDYAPALAGMGVTLRRRGLPEKALTFFDLAVAATPHDPDIRAWRAMAIMAAGDYLRGFAEYEWRLHAKEMLREAKPSPRWRGERLRGRTLLVHGEAGLGDCLQFCRYLAPLLRELDGRLVVQMPKPLVRLMSRLPGMGTIVSYDEPTPAHDLSCSVMSLPYVFATTIDTIPGAHGYLECDPALSAGWQEKLAKDTADWAARTRSHRRTPLKIGLVWSGGKRPWHLQNTLTDNRRSTSLSILAPLAAAGEDVLFYSLQIGGPQDEAATPPPGMQVIDHTAHIADFDDTAALVSLLDLVIAVDTSTAHVAAALGRPVWMLSRYDQCWRWLPGRTDSPWYSTLRIYTQAAPLDWTLPVSRIADDLVNLASVS